MKKLMMILGLISLAAPIQARAQAVAFDYTGNTQEAIDSPGAWYSSGSNYTGDLSFSTSVNGQPGQDLFGAREQVIFNQPTNISFLDYTILSQAVSPETISFTYTLDGVAQSGPISFAITRADANDGQNKIFTGEVPFNADVAPGTYWLTERGTTGSGLYTTSQTYIDPLTGPVAAPEPSTWVLFSGLVLFILFKGRQRGTKGYV